MNLPVSDVFQVALAVLASLGGGAVIVAGMSAWLGRVWADRLMQNNIAKHNRELEQLKTDFEAVNKRVQAELDKTLHVHHAQFETEFKALIDIWEKVSGVRSAISASPPRVATTVTRPDEMLGLFEPMVRRVAESLDELKRAVDQQSPFYPKTIYDKLEELIMAVGEQEWHLQRHYSQGDVNAVSIWFELNPSLMEKVVDLANQVSRLMRERIESLSVYRE